MHQIRLAVNLWTRAFGGRVFDNLWPSCYNIPLAPVAQWIESLTSNQKVVGSSPAGRAKKDRPQGFHKVTLGVLCYSVPLCQAPIANTGQLC